MTLTYQQALAYIYSFSDFERTGQFSREPEQHLFRMKQLLEALGNPHNQFSSTHIAGTKGKGSTAVLIASALQYSGIKTGLYTQPDLHTFRERIVLNGRIIRELEIVELVEDLQIAITTLPQLMQRQFITFEVGTALAFMAFARYGMRHAVIEVGLGGRLDPTNIIRPLINVITPISYDHMSILGNSLAEIAAEKAGIIKAGTICITGPQQPEVMPVLTQTCSKYGVPLIRVSKDDNSDYVFAPDLSAPARSPQDLKPIACAIAHQHVTHHLQIGLPGAYQCINAAVAFAALDALQTLGLPVEWEGVEQGFLLARWSARMDIVGYQPWIVIDGAHNADSVSQLFNALPQALVFSRCHLLLGTMRDKDIAGIAEVLLENNNLLASVWTVSGSSPRAFSAADLLSLLPQSLPLHKGDNIEHTLPQVLQFADPADIICITGSLYLAGEALRYIASHHADPLAKSISIAGNDHRSS